MVLDQLYCELLVDRRLRGGGYRRLSPGEARRLARALARLLEAPPGRRLAGLTVVGEAAGVYWAVSPDLAVTRGDRVAGLVRARIRRSLRVYESDYGLLQLAALVLDNQGLLDDDAVLLVIVGESREALARGIEETLAGPRIRPLIGRGWRASTRVYDRGEAEALAGRLSGYWLGARPPEPRPSPSRCSRCPLAGECPYSAAGHSGGAGGSAYI